MHNAYLFDEGDHYHDHHHHHHHLPASSLLSKSESGAGIELRDFAKDLTGRQKLNGGGFAIHQGTSNWDGWNGHQRVRVQRACH